MKKKLIIGLHFTKKHIYLYIKIITKTEQVTHWSKCEIWMFKKKNICWNNLKSILFCLTKSIYFSFLFILVKSTLLRRSEFRNHKINSYINICIILLVKKEKLSLKTHLIKHKYLLIYLNYFLEIADWKFFKAHCFSLWLEKFIDLIPYT